LHAPSSSGKTVRGPVGSEIATSNVPRRADEGRGRATRRDARVLVVLLLGPLVMLGGLVWAVAQPYRITFLHREDKGLYDFVVQPPLLVILVGIFFALVLAPGLVDDLESEEDGPAA